uniref:Fe2OG dioxygenase domain-containing protein n=1 Tax=Chromera velia CCMP2878 TaxID=1169474 RepID=A0A0G4GZH9_9ALVE|eukprot:Cvel_5430.t1-p1 / transcript=Cvel_5430.t1 / gene=Cvel_5430 / organism=Chromera_velia_CCMP2878 / gene_product=hypothetical protein / transcript_product=hypothetical protein / location=Cvel_scaffold253:6453-11010(+) / protein_length=579 / sequence_SO=supercontig / SO=protein_coding / is_pseudo=false
MRACVLTFFPFFFHFAIVTAEDPRRTTRVSDVCQGDGDGAKVCKEPSSPSTPSAPAPAPPLQDGPTLAREIDLKTLWGLPDLQHRALYLWEKYDRNAALLYAREEVNRLGGPSSSVETGGIGRRSGERKSLVDALMVVNRMEFELMRPVEALQAALRALELCSTQKVREKITKVIVSQTGVLKKQLDPSELSVLKIVVPKAFDLTEREKNIVGGGTEEEEAKTEETKGPLGPLTLHPVSAQDLSHGLRMLWPSPILHVNLVKEGAVNSTSISSVKESALSAFLRFIREREEEREEEWAERGGHGGRGTEEKRDLNNEFFSWQTKAMYDEDQEVEIAHRMASGSGVPEFHRNPAFREVRDAVEGYMRGFAETTGMDMSPYQYLYSWAGVHGQNTHHAVHVHEDSVVSAVFYCAAPGGAAGLTLYDPRGRHPLDGLSDSEASPPFGGGSLKRGGAASGAFIISPREGDLVVFPSWLRHGVGEGSNVFTEEPRVSVAFNLRGQWAAGRKVADLPAVRFEVPDSNGQREGPETASLKSKSGTAEETLALRLDGGGVLRSQSSEVGVQTLQSVGHGVSSVRSSS